MTKCEAVPPPFRQQQP